MMLPIRLLVVLGSLCITAAGIWAQPSGSLRTTAPQASVVASLETDSVLIGDSFSLNIEVQTPDGVYVTLPSFADTLHPNIEILKAFRPDSLRLANGWLSVKAQYTLIGLDSGIFTLSPRTLIRNESGSNDTLFANPVRITVMLAPADSTQNIRDIKPIYSLPLTFGEVWPWIAAIFLLATLLWLLIRMIKKIRRREPLFGKALPILPPHLEALRKLDLLRHEKLWQEGHTKEYYTRLTDILREYLDNRFELSAREQVTSEILTSLRATGFENNRLIERLEYIFSIADMAKFAKALPLADENETALLNAYFFVNNTQPQREGVSGEPIESDITKTE